jgi:hypothetical protein
MSYQPYPTGSDSNQMGRGPDLPQPPSIQTAVKLMYAGAVLSAISLIIGLATIGSLKSDIRSADPSYTTSQVNSAEGVIVASVVIGGLLGIGLWLWMARANGAGRSWARVVASILFGISTLELITGVTRANSPFNLLFEGLVWLVGLGAIVFLWRRDSSEYYAARSR